MSIEQRQRGKTPLSNEEMAALRDGLTVSQIARTMGLATSTVQARLAGIPSNGARNGSPIYKLRDCLPALWTPSAEQIDQAMRTMSARELPKMLTRDYWAGMKARQDYELRAGDLWPTSKVIEDVGALFKLVKLSAQLMCDAVERQTELTERQRTIIRDMTDGMLTQLHKAVIEKFTRPEPVASAPIEEDDDEL